MKDEKRATREISSLHGLIRVQRMEPPPTGLFVMCPRKVEDIEGKPHVQAEIEAYALMSSLSPELRSLVKKEMLENAPEREVIIASLHPDTRAEYDTVRTRFRGLEAEMEQDTEKAKEGVDVKPSEMFAGNPVKMAISIVEKELGQPIPDFIKTTPEALGDILVLHGQEEVVSVARAIRKEMDYYHLVNEQGVDPEEAQLRVFGPPPG